CHKSSHKYSIHWGTSSFVGRGFSLASTSRPLLKGVPAPNPKLPLASQTDIRSSLASPFSRVKRWRINNHPQPTDCRRLNSFLANAFELFPARYTGIKDRKSPPHSPS